MLPLSIRGLQFLSVFEPKDRYLEGFLNYNCGFLRMTGPSAEQIVKVSINGVENTLVGSYKNESIHLLELKYEDLTNGEIFIQSINDSKEAEVHHLIDLINSWKTAGYPYTGNLRVRAYPVQSEYVPSSQEKMIIAPNTKFIFSKTP